jgi:hypothetical protein
MLTSLLVIIGIAIVAISIIVFQQYGKQLISSTKWLGKKENFSLKDPSLHERYTNAIIHIVGKANSVAANYMMLTHSDMEIIKNESLKIAESIATKYDDTSDKACDELSYKLREYLVKAYFAHNPDEEIMNDITEYLDISIKRDIYALLREGDFTTNLTNPMDYQFPDDPEPHVDLSKAQAQTLSTKHFNDDKIIKMINSGSYGGSTVPPSIVPLQVQTNNLIYGIPRTGLISARNGITSYDPRGLNPGSREMLMKKHNSKDPNSLQRSSTYTSSYGMLQHGKGITNDETTDQSIDYHGEMYNPPEHKALKHFMDRFEPVSQHSVDAKNHELSQVLGKNIMFDIVHAQDPAFTNLHI